jgi:Putative beta barrel porin-7 (BBP7)
VNVGFKLTDWMNFRVGYTFLYISDVVRPGAQIDRNINSNTQPLTGPTVFDPVTGAPIGTAFSAVSAPARPQFTFQRDEFWAQGVNFGLEFKF